MTYFPSKISNTKRLNIPLENLVSYCGFQGKKMKDIMDFLIKKSYWIAALAPLKKPPRRSGMAL
jgi:hypothetical protein